MICVWNIERHIRMQKSNNVFIFTGLWNAHAAYVMSKEFCPRCQIHGQSFQIHISSSGNTVQLPICTIIAALCPVFIGLLALPIRNICRFFFIFAAAPIVLAQQEVQERIGKAQKHICHAFAAYCNRIRLFILQNRAETERRWIKNKTK
jgi:hypothetical protein